MQDIDPREIRLRAMNLLARREHLRQELALKLRKRFGEASGNEIATALDRLEEEGLLSDSRFTESFIRHRSARGYGPDRIRQELRHKGVDGSQLDEAMEAADVDWLAIAREVREKKFGDTKPGDFSEKARQLRFLNYRGFGGEYARSVLDYDGDI